MVLKSLSYMLLPVLIFGLGSCAPQSHNLSLGAQIPKLIASNFFTSDGTSLPVRTWAPDKKVKAVLIALHGFNDYSNFFHGTGVFLKSKGILSYAFDQRGFGFTNSRGRWSGTNTYINDLSSFITLVKTF